MNSTQYKFVKNKCTFILTKYNPYNALILLGLRRIAYE